MAAPLWGEAGLVSIRPPLLPVTGIVQITTVFARLQVAQAQNAIAAPLFSSSHVRTVAVEKKVASVSKRASLKIAGKSMMILNYVTGMMRLKNVFVV